MKKLFFICLVAITAVACKNEAKTGTPELFRGEFIYTADAAVLKGEDYIYGVELGAMAEELSEKVTPLKREDFDMVPVVVMGIKKPNPDAEGWDEIIEITEIMGVQPPTSDLATKINASQGKESENAGGLSVPPEPIAPPVSGDQKETEVDHSGHNLD